MEDFPVAAACRGSGTGSFGAAASRYLHYANTATRLALHVVPVSVMLVSVRPGKSMPQ